VEQKDDRRAQGRARTFCDAVERSSRKIKSWSGEAAKVQARGSDYVIEGCLIELMSDKGSFPFWVGLNVGRIFFIAWVSGVDTERAREAFSFCFGGAQKVGWSVFYEPVGGQGVEGVSAWATCETKDGPLAQARADGRWELTEAGEFWSTDVAMMAQSWMRVCEREGIARHPQDPAPL
jgi:hypothetical protein